MAAPLVLRLIADATDYFKTADSVVSVNTKMGQSALAMGADFAKAADAQVAAGTKAIQVQRAMVAELTAAQAKTAAGSDENIAATVALESAQSRLNRTMGISASGFGATSRGAQDAERDLSKMTRGALAGTGVVSSLGRSLAFASGGFLAVAGGATLLVNSITNAEDLAKAQESLTTAIKDTGGDLAVLQPQYAATAKAAAEFGISEADATTGLARATVLTGNAAAAQRAYQEALVISKATGKDFNSVLTATSKGQDGVTTSLRRYGVLVSTSSSGTEQFAEVMKRFGGQAAANTTSLQVLEAELANAGATIGTVLLPTFTRLTTEFSDWLSEMQESGRLQRDANEAFTVTEAIFHTLERAIKRVDDATGGFNHTIAILIAYELGTKIAAWIVQLRVLAGEWGLVGAAATKAGTAQAAAVSESEAASTGSAGGGSGAVTGLLAGGLVGRLLGRGTTGVSARVGMYTGEGAATGEAGAISTTGIGALVVASILAASALDSLAKTIADKFGAGSGFNNAADALTGFLTGGLAGNANYSPLHGYEDAFNSIFGSAPKPVPVQTPQQLQTQLGVSTDQLFGTPPSQSVFGSAQPMTQFWKTFTLTFKEQMAQAQAALTKSNADDVAAAKQVVARIKQQIDEGNIHGPALFQALQLEANALSTIWSAEAAAAQKQAAEAAAAKAKIQAQIENSIDPIRQEVALSRAQATGNQADIVKTLKELRDSAENALKTENLTLKQQKEAWDQIASLNQQIKDASTAAVNQFTEPMKLQIDLAREQAFGTDTTSTLREMKAAALKALKSGKYSGQSLIDLLNEIADINSQLNSQTTTAYGDYKKASLKAETAGLGLTRAQRQALEARLSQRGPGGTSPGSGTGAAGYVIDPETGRPVNVRHARSRSRSGRVPSAYGGGANGEHFTFNFKIELDGKQLTSVVTRGQQNYRKSNPSSRRGPHAATQTA